MYVSGGGLSSGGTRQRRGSADQKRHVIIAAGAKGEGFLLPRARKWVCPPPPANIDCPR